MDKRIGTVIILVRDKQVIAGLNQMISEHSDIVIGRQGIPFFNKDKEISLISLVIYGDVDSLGSLTGKLGRLRGVSVKSALLKNTESEKNGADFEI
ncbi:MAG: hypothetical protein R6U19_02800 [Bacteroidales bacterium]